MNSATADIPSTPPLYSGGTLFSVTKVVYEAITRYHKAYVILTKLV